MKVVIPGGTGQVGTVLARAFHRDGHEVVVLSRTPRAAPWRVLPWDARTVGDWAAELDGADAVINLAGRSVNCRYTPANRRAIARPRAVSATPRPRRSTSFWPMLTERSVTARWSDGSRIDIAAAAAA